MGNISSPENGSVGRHFKIFSSHAVNVLQDSVSETVIQVVPPYALDEVVLAVCGISYLYDRIVPTLKNFDEQRNIIQKLLFAENTIQRYACEKFES